MTIEKVLGVPKESILNKEHNLWIGISLGNKWFTKENIKELIELGLQYTKETLLVEIPGRLHATNLRYFDDMGRAEALKKAFEMEDEKISEIKSLISNLAADEQSKVIIANYDDVLTASCIKKREQLMREFSKQELFYQQVMEISDDMLEVRGRSKAKSKAESISLYILHELPWFLDGIQKIGSNSVHGAVLYPGLGKIDELIMDILTNKEFESLRDRLELTHDVGIVSVK